jgi:colanic acid/amylovoran biosynthesis protein
MNVKKIAIVGGNPYNKNLGVGALGYSALTILNDVVKENNLKAEFTFFGSDKNISDKIVIKGEEIHFDNILNVRFYSWKTTLKQIFFKKRFKIDKIEKFDYVFDISEGDSFTDIYGDDRFRTILNTKKYFSNLGTTQVMFPQTIGPFKDQIHEKEAFEVMNTLDMVISRDKQSFDYSKKFLPAAKIAETIDGAFYMPFEKKTFSDDKVNVGINVSGLLWGGGYTKNNQFGMKTDYQTLIRRTIEYFTKQSHVRVYLVPHVYTVDQSVEDDYEVCKLLIEEYSNLEIAPVFATPIEAKSYISGLDFFTGARMHACIAAFSSGVPVFPMAYSRKFNGLFGETLKYASYGDCVNENDEAIFTKLIGSFESREALKVQISVTNNTIVKDRLSLLKSAVGRILKK